MKPGFFAPKGTLEKKPPHGAPCNRCGLCCVASLCPLAARVFRGKALTPGIHEPGPCPALSFDHDGQSVCGLVADPARFALGIVLRAGVDAAVAAAKQLIGSGTGCDARMNGEPKNEAFYLELERHDRRTAAQTRTAHKIWRMS